MMDEGSHCVMVGEDEHASAHVKPSVFVAAHAGGGREKAAFRRAVVIFAGTSLVFAAVLAAAIVGTEGQGGATELKITRVKEASASDVAAYIIAGAKGFNRELDDLMPHQDPETPADTRLEANYGALANAIVKHGRGVLYRLIHGPPPKPKIVGIPMPQPSKFDYKDPDFPPDPVPTPAPTPHPDPNADQGKVAENIILASNAALTQALAEALIAAHATPPPAEPASIKVLWQNKGAAAEDNALNLNYLSHEDADDPARPFMGTKYTQHNSNGGRNYWHVNTAGENTDTKLVDGAPVMQEGALGGGHAPGSSDGAGPAISVGWPQDNGAPAAEAFTIDTSQDDGFHGSKPTWLPVNTATEQTGLTAADTGGGLSDMAYLSDFGKKAPSSKPVKGSALTITMPSDNAANGEAFTISTASADSFDCGNNCEKSPTADIVGDPDAPTLVDKIMTDANALSAAAAAGAAPAAQPPPGPKLYLLPAGVMHGDVIRERPGPAGGESGDAGPAPI